MTPRTPKEDSATLEIKPVRTSGANVHILKNRCKGCGFCIEFCPLGVLEFSEGINERGAHFPNVKNESKCNACRICEGICPDFAIFVVKRENSRRR